MSFVLFFKPVFLLLIILLPLWSILDEFWLLKPSFQKPFPILFFIVAQSLSYVQHFVTPWTVAHQAPVSTLFQSLCKSMLTESVCYLNYLILCLPLLLPSFPKHQGLFQWVGSLHQVAKVLELQLQHHLFQWTLKNDFLSNRLVWSPSSSRDSQASSQHHNLKASILWCPSLFMVQFSYLYMTTGKTIALTRWTFARKAKSLLFNMLSSL